ncbi:hypothetical protein [Halostagnicola sp. A-GB9-2]|uniref:hypothetical protein n=1 Tax=Halostagnicola sp. A-GB9-2 TaxID=3048066 RepID=UPI0024C0D085|nr:hypothetical protein [Halostagnicola sp. A-GB9-2]MDJ1430716.1 hypothetical protein [Halostagnicola sp. A-GB9-2]
MSEQSASTKTVGVCTHCGAFHAVCKRPDRSVYAIGSPQGCHCSETEFRLLEE